MLPLWKNPRWLLLEDNFGMALTLNIFVLVSTRNVPIFLPISSHSPHYQSSVCFAALSSSGCKWLTFKLSCMWCVLVIFSYSVLCQLWHLTVSITDLCPLPYLDRLAAHRDIHAWKYRQTDAQTDLSSSPILYDHLESLCISSGVLKCLSSTCYEH